MPTIYAPTATDNRSAAISLAELGLPIFPCAPGKKIFLAGSHGYRDASSDPAVADRRWKALAPAKVGFPIGLINGRMVLNVGWRNGANEDDLPANCFKTTVVRTPGSLGDRPDHGIHLHFDCPSRRGLSPSRTASLAPFPSVEPVIGPSKTEMSDVYCS